VHEALDVLAGDGGDAELTQEGLDVTRDPASVERDSARLLLRPTARYESASFGVG
jgi:hypothetical protein